jgi:hypothetical protein
MPNAMDEPKKEEPNRELPNDPPKEIRRLNMLLQARQLFEAGKLKPRFPDRKWTTTPKTKSEE